MIVVGVDFSEDSHAALRWAVAEGRVMGTPVTAVHAGPPVFEPVRDTPVAAERREERMPALAEFVDAVDPDVGRRVVDGPAWRALVEASEDADLVVVGRHGLGAIGRTVLGSVSHDVVRHARCPVAVVPRAAPFDVARVVVGTDGSANAEAAVRWAAAEAVRRGVPLHLVHASPMGGTEFLYDEDATRAFVDDAAARLREETPGLEVTTFVSWTSPTRAILYVAGEDSLVVVGSRGRGAVARVLLGSTSAVVIEESAGTAIVVPPTS